MRRLLPVVVILLALMAPSLPTGAQTTSGEAPLLRLYGCGDDLDRGDPAAPVIGPDGVLDCTGDQVRFPAAWLSGAADPGLRAALPTHDQRIDLTFTYHPTYWAPAPGSTLDPRAEVARPGSPTQGLFDNVPTGLFDASYVDDEAYDRTLDDNDAPDRIDLLPHDGLWDRHERNDGRNGGADLYFPAVETRYDLTWWREGNDPEPLPDRGRLVFPGVAPVSGVSHPDAWREGEAPPRLQWSSRPLGIGTGNDGLGAVVTAPFGLSPGDTVRFLDHSVRLDRFVENEGRMAASVAIAFTGAGTPETIGTDLLLDLDASDQTPATLDGAGTDARNVMFADTRTSTRAVPLVASGVDADDDAWFVILEGVDDAVAPTGATVRIGRLVSNSAPLNTMLVDGGLYRVADVREIDGALATFAWSRIVPLGDTFRFRNIGVDMAGVQAEERLPLLPPFDRDHTHLVDMRPAVARDVYGFLQETPEGNGIIATDQLALAAGAMTPADRARRTDALAVRWADEATEARLGVTHVQPDGSIARSLVAPFRYVLLRMPDMPALVHSALLDDADLIRGATEARNTPRAARSFVLDPGESFQLYGGAGLRVYGGTRADANAADVLRVASGLIRPAEYIGQTRLPTALAAQRTDVDVRYQPHHIYEVTGRGLLAISDESIDRDIDADADSHIIDAQRGARGDNLYDIAPRNNDPRFADVYGPVLEVRYTGRLIDPGTYRAIDAPFDVNTRIHIPAADRDATKPGLDSADLDGDGNDEGVVLAGFWDRDAGGAVADHWKAAGTFDSSRDLVLLQSPLVDVPLGGEARFFDHGVTYMAFDGPNRNAGTFGVTNLQPTGAASAPAAIATAPNVAPGRGDCLTVQRDGSAQDSVVDCATRAAAATSGSNIIGPDADKWWVEIVELGAASASVRMHRVFAPPGAGEEIWIGGALYEWGEWIPGVTTGIASWRLHARVPLGSAVLFDGSAPSPSLPAVGFGGRVPLLPPFDGRHLVLPQSGVAPAVNTYGVETGAAAGSTASRVRWVDDLVVQVKERDQERAHRFVHLDPTRWVDPTRAPGHAFVGGTFADPGAGIVSTTPWLDRAPDRLRTVGPGGFDEALRGSGARGWDHFVVLDLPFDQGPYLLDSARLGAPSRVASVDAVDPWTSGRSSAYFLHDPARPADLYLRLPAAAAVPPPPGVDPRPSPVPNGDPDPGDERPTEDGSAPGLVLGVVALAGAAIVWRRVRP